MGFGGGGSTKVTTVVTQRQDINFEPHIEIDTEQLAIGLRDVGGRINTTLEEQNKITRTLAMLSIENYKHNQEEKSEEKRAQQLLPYVLGALIVWYVFYKKRS